MKMSIFVMIVVTIVGCTSPNQVVMEEGTSSVATVLPGTSNLPATDAPSTATQQPTPFSTDSPMASTTPANTTPTALATVTPKAHVDFNPVIAFKGKTSGEWYDQVSTYDTASDKLTVVAEGIGLETFESPSWSPQGDLLAFIQSETSIVLYNPDNSIMVPLELARPNPPDGLESKIGLALGGWSFNGEWLSYQYMYDVFPGESYLLNRNTGESYYIGFPKPVNWLEWSPRGLQIAGFNSESIYVGEASNPEELSNAEAISQYELVGHNIYRLAWHPEENGLLVSTTEEDVLSSLNDLWYLNLDTGEQIYIGEYRSILDMAYSPDLAEIAISSTHFVDEDNQLFVIDAKSFETIAQFELPQGELFTQVKWLEASVPVLKANDNLYVLPIDQSGQAYWVLDPTNNPLGAYASVRITDW